MPALIINSLPFHPGDVGFDYVPVTATASGGKQPYRWSISSGSLPPGLSMSTGGVTTGTPTTLGGYGFTVRVDDAAGGAAGYGGKIDVNPALSLSSSPCIQDKPCGGEEGCVDVCGGPFSSQSGGSGPYQYQVTAGALPGGTRLNGLTLAGTLSGVGNTNFTAAVTDAAGAGAAVTAYYQVLKHISIDGPVSFKANVDTTPPAMTVNYSTPSFFASTLTTKGLPPGFTVTLDQNQPWIHVNAPVSQKGGPVSFDITITDGYTCSVGSRCSATATITVTYK